MRNFNVSILLLTGLLFNALNTQAKSYPDQFYDVYGADSLLFYIEEQSNITKSNDGISLELVDGEREGYFILEPYTFKHDFNRGLPSWNGTAPENESAGFKVEMRFFVNNQWSDWLMVGYWDNYIWGSYGKTDFSYGRVDIDYVKLFSYCTTFQYKVTLKKSNLNYATPKIRRLCFAVSDSETPVNIDAIVDDNPEEYYVSTDFVYQYGVDDEIGGSICSPTSVSMILKSFDKDIDPYNFAQRTYDSYFGIFGVWPRVVTHASEYGLKGAVTRYRTWSQTLDVLKNGGRIAMSVGQPLYAGHLIMLAGFNAEGQPIVHDPAKSTGEAYIFNKRDISESWFNKGGISYTFYTDENYTSVKTWSTPGPLLSAYPNPANGFTRINLDLSAATKVHLAIYDMQGRAIGTLHSGELSHGNHEFNWTIPSSIPSGMYFARLVTDGHTKTLKIVTTPF